jgi:hypothetical protein
MRFLMSTFILIFISIQAEAQIEIEQDTKFEQLLKQKNKNSSSLISNDRYKIQIFSGDNENSRKALNDVKKNYSDFESTIVFHTPNYKVWVGNFKNKIEAERILAEIRTTYSNAFLIKPSK